MPGVAWSFASSTREGSQLSVWSTCPSSYRCTWRRLPWTSVGWLTVLVPVLQGAICLILRWVDRERTHVCVDVVYDRYLKANTQHSICGKRLEITKKRNCARHAQIIRGGSPRARVLFDFKHLAPCALRPQILMRDALTVQHLSCNQNVSRRCAASSSRVGDIAGCVRAVHEPRSRGSEVATT